VFHVFTALEFSIVWLDVYLIVVLGDPMELVLSYLGYMGYIFLFIVVFLTSDEVYQCICHS
jgi:hypothetical protein